MILINSTAATEGGALTVLKQLLSNLPRHFQFIVFVSVDFSELPILVNVKYVNPNAKPAFKRLYWDNFGLNKWCNVNLVKPDLIISMQNTGVKIDGNIKQIIYYHQPTPLFEYNWNPFKANERNLWFYKHIYPWFVKYYINRNTIFVTQFDWISKKLSKIINIPIERVFTINPSVTLIDTGKISLLELQGELKIFFPAANYIYKNHIEIINAVGYLKDCNKLGDIKVYFSSVSIDDSSILYSLIRELGLENYFIFLGYPSYEEILRYFKSCDIVVFPSYLETFGLPLVEAAKFGKKILAADLDYAREVLAGYDGVTYLPIHNPCAWGDAIHQCMEQKEQFDSWEPGFGKNSWQKFFQLVEDFIRR